MKTSRFPWSCVWMAAFSATGLWLIWRQLQPGFAGADWSEHTLSQAIQNLSGAFFRQAAFADFRLVPRPPDLIISFVMLAIVFVVAVSRMVAWIPYDEQGRHYKSDDPGWFFLRALKQMWAHEWILWTFGLISVVHVADALVSYSLNRYYLIRFVAASRLTEAGFRFHGLTVPGLPKLLTQAVPQSPLALMHFSGLESPQVGILFTALAVMVLSIWAYLRLSRTPEDSNGLKFARAVAAVSAAASLVALIASPVFIIPYLRAVAAGDLHPPQTVALAVSGWVWDFVLFVVVTPAVVGGILGSLRSSAQGEVVTRESFLDEAVRYLKPLMGVYFLVYIVESLLGPTIFTAGIFRGQTMDFFGTVARVLAAMILMLVPYAIVVDGLGVWSGVKHSLTTWLEQPGLVVRFVALGITLISVFSVVERLIVGLAPRLSRAQALISLAQALIAVFTAALVTLAVWEFYQVISRPGREVSLEEAEDASRG